MISADEIMQLHAECLSKMATPANTHGLRVKVGKLASDRDDLLAALEALLLTHCYQVKNADLDPAVTDARVAIRKARGES